MFIRGQGKDPVMIPRIDTVPWTPERGWRGKLLCGQTGILEPRETLFVLVIRLRGYPTCVPGTGKAKLGGSSRGRYL